MPSRSQFCLTDFYAAEGRPLPGQVCPIDMPDDFFRVRLVCVLLDTCGMCFDRGAQQKKLDYFLSFFQVSELSRRFIAAPNSRMTTVLRALQESVADGR